MSFSVMCTSPAESVQNPTHSVGLEYVLLESLIAAYCKSFPSLATVTVAGVRARVSFNDDVAAERAESRIKSSSTSTSSSRKFQNGDFHSILT